jgi:5-methylcytosine-specific restriction endonuclease McrA
MPDCLHPDGRAIVPGLPGNDPWQASIDHIVPLTDGGQDSAANKRAAHKRCNGADTTALALSLAQLAAGRVDTIWRLTRRPDGRT